jgi:hypothetical protein
VLLVLYDGDPPEAINVTLDSFLQEHWTSLLVQSAEMRVTTSVDRLARSRVILL